MVVIRSHYQRIARRLRVITASAAIATAALAGSAFPQSLEFRASNQDGSCPAGYQLATPAEARANPGTACGVLGPWYIARLAGGGSMDGPGYNCKIRNADRRPLGNSLCRRSALARFTVTNNDGTCPAGYVLASASEARAEPQAACAVLGTWYIARLAGGGSMDGPGYNCKIRDTDTRALGNSLCRLGAAAAYGRTSACIADTLLPTLNRQTDVAAWVLGQRRFAERQSFSTLADGFSDSQFASEAARNYCRDKGYNWSLPQVRADRADAHLDVQCCSQLTPRNSTAAANISQFVTSVIDDPAVIDDITEAEGLDDIYKLAKQRGYDIPLKQLQAIMHGQSGPTPRLARRAASCGGFGEPPCAQCAVTATYYFPFNLCCFPMKTSCVEYSPIGHCNPGLRPSGGTCVINRSDWNEVPIDTKRKGPTCGHAGQISCWQQDDQDRDHLETDTAKLNFVTVLSPNNRALPSGTRFIYVYRKADNRIVLRNYDRDEADKQYMYPGNCRERTSFGNYPCTTGGGRAGRYLHARHSQLNHPPGSPVGNNWNPVWCAGEMRIEDGRVCLINNESGHFKPPASCIPHVEQTLKAWGVPTASWMLTGDFNSYKAGQSCASQVEKEL